MRRLFDVFSVIFVFVLAACAAHHPVNAQEPTAQAELTIAWAAPTTGGPVTDYLLSCTGSFPIDVVTVGTSYTTTPISVSSGEQLAGTCSVVARNAVGNSPAVTASYAHNVAVTLPPGAPTDFTITLQCTMVDGQVTCEQV